MARRVQLCLITLLTLTLALASIMIRQAGAAPIERNLVIELGGLPSGTKPIRVAFLSDFHTARLGDTPGRLRRTASRVSNLHPDLILLGGDYLADSGVGGYAPREAIAPIAGLSAPLGVFAVLGNHDYAYEHPGVVTRWLSRGGARVLDNDAVRAGPLVIIGVGDAYSHHDRVAAALSAARRLGGVPLIFTHSPDIVPGLPAAVQLVLAGHTHCGQIILPLIGAVETRSRYGSRYLCGIVREGRRIAVISSGLGVSRVPFRLGTAPDFWLITIVPPR